MCRLDEIRARRKEILHFAQKNKIGKVLVFGSCARGEDTPASDIDFLVEFNPSASLLDQVHMRNDLSAMFHVPVDVVSVNGLSPLLRNDILSEAVAI